MGPGTLGMGRLGGGAAGGAWAADERRRWEAMEDVEAKDIGGGDDDEAAATETTLPDQFRDDMGSLDCHSISICHPHPVRMVV